MSDASSRAKAGGTRWHPFATSAALIADARNRVIAAADEAISTRGRFIIVLSGGNTPRALYRSLRDAETDWTRWHVYYGDERCVAAHDAGRNSVMAAETLLDAVAIPREQCHTIPGELGADAAADAYAATLRDVGMFDLVLLGLGEDGHVASLFSHASEHRFGSRGDVVAISNAPKPPPERVSLSAARLSDARVVLFLVSGESKRDAVRRWREGEPIAAAGIQPAAGVDVLIDAALLPG
ncbi:MAG: 6-phosphogluconolactonase [Rhodanobacteraceae bacterium]